MAASRLPQRPAARCPVAGGAGRSRHVDPGNDKLTGGSGVDAYHGGDGGNEIIAFDGLAEEVDCAGGTDTATVDSADRLGACENVRRVYEIVDADHDGSIPPADCDDNDPTRHPRAVDVPRNGKDGDCSSADADFGRVRSTVQNQWAFNRTFTLATKFTVRDVPAAGTVRLRCKAPKGKRHACPFSTRKRESVSGRRS